MKRQIYLDHQAATPVLPEALAAMLPFFREDFGNPASLHHLGLNARDALARARGQFAALLNAELPEEILFTVDEALEENTLLTLYKSVLLPPALTM